MGVPDTHPTKPSVDLLTAARESALAAQQSAQRRPLEAAPAPRPGRARPAGGSHAVAARHRPAVGHPHALTR
jgi:hypothetical protein